MGHGDVVHVVDVFAANFIHPERLLVVVLQSCAHGEKGDTGDQIDIRCYIITRHTQ